MHSSRDRDADDDAANGRTPREEYDTAEDHAEGAEPEHDESVPADPFDNLKEFLIPRETSPEKFYAKLERRLARVGIRYERLTKKTEKGANPPCFKLARCDFNTWVTAAALTPDIPYRYDMPGEVNYCRDCTPEFKARAQKAGACLFPNVKFEPTLNGGEREIVGVSRSPVTAPEGYRIYRQMLIDEDALED